MGEGSTIRPRLLVVAHGTESAQGSATTARTIAALAVARPDVTVDVCFLDVVTPRLPDVLAGPAIDRPTVLVPMLLSTGYHVQADIPAAVAHRPDVVVARHLGPHPLLVDALLDRLPTGPPDTRTVLVGAGSSRPEARTELTETARLLGDRVGGPVEVLTMADDLDAALRAAVPGTPGRVRVATYLLAEGQFVTTLQAAAGDAEVAAPIGVHPALVELVWTRYDEALAALR